MTPPEPRQQPPRAPSRKPLQESPRESPRESSLETPARCPVAHGDGGGASRRSDPARFAGTPEGAAPGGSAAVERRGEVWHLRSYAAVRQVLRDADATRQAGFNAETVARSGMQQPVLFQDGAEHREQRTAIARFFTPATVSGEYRALMETLADDCVAELRRAGGGDLATLSLRLAVGVAARVVGLTDSRRPGMARRLERLLSLERLRHPSRWRRAAALVRSQLHLWSFHLHDVRPAIAARRREPRADVISHLLQQGRSATEILIECVTYGAAGMATTREFIGMAAWHLLDDPALRRRYLVADEAERHRLLHEILRLEPVVGRLYRRAVAELTVEHDGEAHRIPAGALLELDLRAANADPAAVGAAPLQLCPERDLARGVQPPVLSFGDGAHRCPGAFIAIQETDILLQRLLREPLRVERAPELRWNELIESYELRGFEVRVEAGGAAGG